LPKEIFRYNTTGSPAQNFAGDNQSNLLILNFSERGEGCALPGNSRRLRARNNRPAHMLWRPETR